MMHDNDDAAAMLPLSFPSFVLCTIVAVVVSQNLYSKKKERKQVYVYRWYLTDTHHSIVPVFFVFSWNTVDIVQYVHTHVTFHGTIDF